MATKEIQCPARWSTGQCAADNASAGRLHEARISGKYKFVHVFQADLLSCSSSILIFEILGLEGARGIEPPPGLLGLAKGFAVRGVPSTIATEKAIKRFLSRTERVFQLRIEGTNWVRRSLLA
jgi:hypothetical protein